MRQDDGDSGTLFGTMVARPKAEGKDGNLFSFIIVTEPTDGSHPRIVRLLSSDGEAAPLWDAAKAQACNVGKKVEYVECGGPRTESPYCNDDVYVSDFADAGYSTTYQRNAQGRNQLLQSVASGIDDSWPADVWVETAEHEPPLRTPSTRWSCRACTRR